MAKQLKIFVDVLEIGLVSVMYINEGANLWIGAARAIIVVIKRVENSDVGRSNSSFGCGFNGAPLYKMSLCVTWLRKDS